MVSPLLRELILRAVRERMLDARDQTHRALVDLIVHECSPSPAPPLDLPLPRSARLRQVAEHLANHSSDRVSHARLARHFGIGVRTLERGFVAETGLSLGQWRRHARFMDALRQLGAGSSVKRAAIEAGYRTPSAFVAAFRSSFRTTPGRYSAPQGATPSPTPNSIGLVPTSAARVTATGLHPVMRDGDGARYLGDASGANAMPTMTQRFRSTIRTVGPS